MREVLASIEGHPDNKMERDPLESSTLLQHPASGMSKCRGVSLLLVVGLTGRRT
jgi:hypothetical protein